MTWDYSIFMKTQLLLLSPLLQSPYTNNWCHVRSTAVGRYASALFDIIVLHRKIQSRHRALVILPTIDPGRELNQFESAWQPRPTMASIPLSSHSRDTPDVCRCSLFLFFTFHITLCKCYYFFSFLDFFLFTFYYVLKFSWQLFYKKIY